MQVYGTPPPVISLDEAAEAAGLSEDDLRAALAANSRSLVTVSGVKFGVRPADLDEISAGASATTTIHHAPAIVEGQDTASWGTASDFVPTLGISGTPVLTGTLNVAYAGFTVTASGGDQPYTYSLVGTWPTGLAVGASTGAVSGTPTQSGSFPNLSVRVTDDLGSVAQLDVFTLTIAAA